MRVSTLVSVATLSYLFVAGCSGSSTDTPVEEVGSDTGTDSADTGADTGTDVADTGTDTGPKCVDPAKDCPASASACAPAACGSDGKCTTTTAAKGAACTDSGGKVCDGSGKCVGCLAPTDCPATGTTCATATCDANKCGVNNAALGTSCSQGKGVVCDGGGKCVEAHCTDKVLDADETDIDCGGSCSGCDLGGKCKVTTDCKAGGACDTGVCVAITCTATAPKNGKVGGGTTAVTVAFGASAAYTCDTGYALTGAVPTCGGTTKIGTLSGAEPTCAPVDCGAPPTPTNANASTVSGGLGGGSTTTYNAVATINCKAGYARSGPNQLCLATGSWSAAPTCIVAEFVKAKGSVSSNERIWASAFDATGNMFTIGDFNGSPSNYGDGVTLTPTGGNDVALVAYDSFGVTLWGVAIGGSGNENARGLARDASGNLYIAGTSYSTSMKVDATTTLTGSGGFLLSYTDKGVYRWGKYLATEAHSVTTDATGNVFVSGYMNNGTFDYGSGTAVKARGVGDMFLASYTTGGTYRWANVYGCDQVTFGPPSNAFQALTTDAAGNVYAGGYMGGTNGNVGGTTIPFVAGTGSLTAVIGSYANTGTHRWSKGFTATATSGYNDAQITAVAVDTLGSVAYSFLFRDVVDIGGGSVTTGSSGSNAGVIGMFDSAAGTYLRQRRFVMAPPFLTTTMRFDSGNNLWLAGNSNNGGQDFGSGPLPSGAFVAQYGNDLGYKFARIAAGGAYAYSYGIMPLASGDVMAAGNYDRGVMDWGAGAAPFTGAGGVPDVWLARIRPLPFTNGLSAHYSARDTTTVARNVANVVSGWTDTSGGSRLLTPGTAAPIYGATSVNARPGVDFNSSKSMSASVPLTSTDVTVFVVVKAGTSAPTGSWGPIAFHGSRSADWSIEQNGSLAHFKSNADDAGAQLACMAGSNYVLTGRISGSSRTFYRTDSLGTTTSTATGVTITTGTKALTLGLSGTDASNAAIGEIVYFQRALTDVEVAQMIAYLGTGWGI